MISSIRSRTSAKMSGVIVNSSPDLAECHTPVQYSGYRFPAIAQKRKTNEYQGLDHRTYISNKLTQLDRT